jgi:hypothetical protein
MNKRITYDRDTRDYRAELDGEVIGYFKTYHAAETELNRLAFEAASRGQR